MAASSGRGPSGVPPSTHSFGPRPPLVRLGLRGRLLVAQLLVVAAGIGALTLVVQLVALDAFESSMNRPGMGSTGSMGGMGGMMSPAIRTAFNDALFMALVVALLAAAVTAVLASTAVASWLARPITQMAAASRRIADGRYAERVPIGQSGEIGDLASSFNAMAESLEATERRRLELVGDVAHELRTPLSTLDGYLEGLEDGVIEPSSATWALLREHTSRLARLVGDLQELWQVEARQVPLRTATVTARDIWTQVAARFRQSAEARRIELEPDAIDDDLRISADRERLGQVLDNLVSNAIRYSPEGSRVVLRGRRAGARAILSVEDQGPGLKGDDALRVFERFYRVEPSRSRALGGSGIGLAIAQALTERMGGRIWAESPGAGQGSTFFVELPAVP